MADQKLRKNMEFRNVYRRGKSFANDLLVLYIYNNRRNRDEKGTPYNRVGISVSKKVGISVIRSRAKRLISESYRLNNENIKRGNDLVFIARVAINEKTYWDVQKAMINLFNKAGLIKNEKGFNSNNKIL
ncbi:ribonuclease P protein component [Clostridium zeae]|uniref:Ribonuclease P protein component n=1 Tax=Clostridium zeae TaxID=2759022 RepID=A0ABQ1EF86_9CLOT|nr:ribonuclease P protein component [Clostridium zeae]GFZ33328.1 ribonuclease P protein component [Clostridium zeae]